MQALGLTSLDLTNLGEQNFETALKGLPGLANDPSLYVTPSEQLQAGESNANRTFQAQQYNSQAGAQANPYAAAMANLAAARGGVQAGAGGGGFSGGGGAGTARLIRGRRTTSWLAHGRRAVM